ncbi:hypothetical protein [Methylobacterium sp. NFXW15]|uniref:hypothetical protein n=1 Tax=Methylobacterium sp. NFXW15 TaxID=2819512 RepID=UPI003CFB546C
MNEALTIPGWVPDGVRLMYEVGPLKNECARRLLTDPRMKAAWTELRKLVPRGDAPTPSYHPPSSYMQERSKFISPGCSPEKYNDVGAPLSDFDRLAAALYYQVILTLSQIEKPMTWTVAEARDMAKPYLEAVKLCDDSIKIESIPSWGNPPRLLNEEIVSALKATRDYLFDQAQIRLMANNPRVLESHETSDPLRAHARSIATMVRDLFGPFPKDFPHAPVTRIFMVSLNENGDIDAMKRRVVKWCQAGPVPISITTKGALPQ